MSTLERQREMNLEDKRWFALLSCFFVGSVTGMQVYVSTLERQRERERDEFRG